MKQKNIEAIYPLSPQQQGMLFAAQIATPHSGLFIEQEVHPLQGPLNLRAFTQAWQSILQRHSILRTIFIWKNQDSPVQVVLENVELPIEQKDLRAFTATDQENRLEEFLDEDRRRGLDLSKPPLMRVTLLQLADHKYKFVWTFHHILMDGWCRPVIFKELASFYKAHWQGVEAQMERSRPYGEYVSWLKQQDLSKAESFWRNQFQNLTLPTPLGREIELNGSPLPEAGFGYEQVSVRAPIVDALQSRLRQHRLTFNTVVQGTWAILLSQYSEREHVVFGTTVSGRPPALEGVETMIGLFINTLPFSVSVPAETSLWDWLEEIQARYVELRHYEHCSTGQIHQWSGLPGARPLYESLLVLENYPTLTRQDHDSNGNSRGDSSRFIGAQTTFPLTLLVAAASEIMVLAVHDRQRVDAGSTARILRHFTRLVEAIATDSVDNVASLRRLVPANELPRVAGKSRLGLAPQAATYVAPTTPTEETVTRIAREVLGMERIGIADSFLSLGGHSLLVTQFVSRLRNAFQIELPLQVLFDSISLKELALVIEAIIMREIAALTDEEAQRMLDAQ